MAINSIDDILPLVEKPSRYLGTEINIIKKDLHRVALRFALIFPDLYEIGTSHFGLQILYHILNKHPDIAAERVFAPDVDMEAQLRRSDLPLFSLESHAPVNQFDIIGFSLLYELNFSNVLNLLDLAGLPLRAAQRDDSHPLVIAGGPCTCNPEPVADFFDAMVVGDGERVIVELSKTWLQWKAQAGRQKFDLLKRWSAIEGVYVPSFFEPHTDARGARTLKPRFDDHNRVQRTIVADLDDLSFPDKPIVPYGKPVHDRLRLEVSRGCTRGCRFCQAGMIYRPVRERAPQTLMALAQTSLEATGYEDVSLLSLSTGDYGCIAPLMEQLMARFATDQVAVSLPSLRAGTLTPELMSLIKTVRKTGFTIAPEAGSQRLRDVINKNITETEIFETVTDAFRLGWRVIKLYFMIGLPTETHADLQALVDLVKRLREINVPHPRAGKINVSVATFIPKPHTPFQWAPQNTLAESTEKINWLKQQLALPGIQFKWQNPEVSMLEGLWARGDRSLSELLIRAYQKGCKFDGWSDKFRFDLWQQAFEEAGIDLDGLIFRQRDTDEPLPWDHIDTRVSKDFLRNEWHKSIQEAFTEDCRDGDCSACGVCDFSELEPRVHRDAGFPAAVHTPSAAPSETEYTKLSLTYSKLDQARYYGHLELMNIFMRAFKRAGIAVKFSKGFHPKPKVSFKDPLPLGLESQCEQITLSVPIHISARQVIDGLNAKLPAGLRIHDPADTAGFPDSKDLSASTYQIWLQTGSFSEEKLAAFNARSELTIKRQTRKGKLKKIDLKAMVFSIELIDSGQLQMTLSSEPGKTLRPGEVLRQIFSISEAQIKQARILKISA
jgi:radical SAM family uncharacterized protein/radical SAM-linked protein